MKLKAAATASLPKGLLEALDSFVVVDFFDEMIAANLSVEPGDIGPATHFVQMTDLTIPRLEGAEGGINVAFTMVSNNRFRSDHDFATALADIESFYTSLIQRHAFAGTRVQLFCVLALEKEIEREEDSRLVKLLETEPKWVNGTAPPE